MTQKGKDNPLSDHPLFAGIAAGVGAGLFYKYATEKLLKGTPLPSALKSELDVLGGQMDAFHPKAMEDLEMKEMNETIRRCGVEDNPEGIVEYATKCLETNRGLLEDAREVEKTIFRVRGMTGGLSDTQQAQTQEVFNLILGLEQNLYATLKIQRIILEFIQDAYRVMKENKGTTLTNVTKIRMQTLNKEYSDAIIKLASSADAFQESAPVKNAESKSTSTNWGASIAKVALAIFSILGATLIAVISAISKTNRKK